MLDGREFLLLNSSTYHLNLWDLCKEILMTSKVGTAKRLFLGQPEAPTTEKFTPEVQT